MFLVTLGYLGWVIAHRSLGFYLRDFPELFPIYFLQAITPFAVARLLRARFKRDALSGLSCGVLLGAALLAVVVARRWFDDPMHDIGLVFGSHGRWGCSLSNEDGSPTYFFRDDIVPWLLFGPCVIAVVWRWLVGRGPGQAPDARKVAT